ncbi:MAG: TonB-dependent receptor [Acidobacteriota bacterium]|nr:TonB-dependent receptor [Acidobacteriota bacterium]
MNKRWGADLFYYLGMPKFRFKRKAFLLGWLAIAPSAIAQSLGPTGTVTGTVRDSSDASAPSAKVQLSHPASGFVLNTRTGSDGSFVIRGMPFDSYRVKISLPGFQIYESDIVIRTAVPIQLQVRLTLATSQASMNVNATVENLIENNPVASDIVHRDSIAFTPAFSPDSGLNDAIIYATPGVAADSNGFFHPMGDHAQVSYVIDGQPVSDQRNKIFSTSIPANAIQTMQIISGSPPAEYGDKTSLVISATTRSGLGQPSTGSFLARFGSFASIGQESTLGLGTPRWGSFLVFNTEISGRFLDSPERQPIHDTGNTGVVFHRLDFQPDGRDAVHLNIMIARNWMQVPNNYDQPLQDQKQKVVSFNVAPGYQHTIDGRTLVSVNTYYRRDSVHYYGSRDPLHDSPATLAQNRSLSNSGVRLEFSGIRGRHNWKAGMNISRTKLDEEFSLGITDAAYNATCLSAGDRIPLREPTDPAQCTAHGLQPNPDFLSGLLRFDLTRGGKLYEFRGNANIDQLAFFGQDSMTIGNLTVNFGLRFDQYLGLADGAGVQPRGAFSYLFKSTKTVLRGGYSHTLETPTNENLVASSSTGSGGLASNLLTGSAEQKPIALGRRNQYDAGIQQSFGSWVLLDVSYFRKYTRNAYDFDALFSTPITFPIGWKQSKLDGVAARISTVEMHGLRLHATMGHANARFFGPENGGVVFNSNLTVGAYRQDHDQVYQQNVNVHYQRARDAWWADFTWRYDSGLVVGAVNSLDDALALTASQQSTIGLYCGAERASLSHRISACDAREYGAERVQILAPGTQNSDHNPPRTKSRHILNVGTGTDNLFRSEHVRTMARFTILNITNTAALYNFLSPFSGTHWVEPRAYQAQFGWAF